MDVAFVIVKAIDILPHAWKPWPCGGLGVSIDYLT